MKTIHSFFGTFLRSAQLVILLSFCWAEQSTADEVGSIKPEDSVLQANRIVIKAIAVTNQSLQSVLVRIDEMINEAIPNGKRPFKRLEIDPGVTNTLPLLTFRGEYVPLTVLLPTIAEATDLECRFNSNSILFVPKATTPSSVFEHQEQVFVASSPEQTAFGDLDELVYRQWNVDAYPPQVEPTDTSTDENWKSFLSRRGVAWPEGSGVWYYRNDGILSVRNTIGNLEVVDSLLKTIGNESNTPKQ